MAKVYLVVDKWTTSMNNSDYDESGTDILKTFASVELADKYIKQYEPMLDHGERIITDKYFEEGSTYKLRRFIELYDVLWTDYHRIQLIEQEVIEKLN